MGGIFGVASKTSCTGPILRDGLPFTSGNPKRWNGSSWEDGFERAIHNIENSPFRTKFERDVEELEGNLGIGCISDRSRSLFWYSPIWEVLPSPRSEKSTTADELVQ